MKYLPPEILRDYFETVYTGRINNKSEREWIIPSFERPEKMKLYINVEKGVGYDFIAGEGYSGYEIIKRIEGFETDEECIEFLLDRLKLKFDKSLFEPKRPPKKEEPLIPEVELPEGLISLFSNHSGARRAKKYLLGRGFGEEDIRKYHLKFCTEGKYRNRIIIPFTEDGKIISFQARSVSDYIVPKYMTAKGTNKSISVFNIDNIEDTCIITEGPFDAMRVNGVAIGGSTASDWQVTKIMRKNPDGLIVVPDNDLQKVKRKNKITLESAGYKGALKTIEKFVKVGFPLEKIKVAFIEGGKDLADLSKEKALEAVSNASPINVKTLLKFKEKGAFSEFLLKAV